MSLFKNKILPIIYTLLIFALDRISKVWVLSYLKPKVNIDILPFFKLTYVQNTGAAFGSFQNGNTILIFVSLAVLFVLIKYREEIFKLGKFAHIAWLFILGGAFGNLYDRIFLGSVVDFINFVVWPVFNIADSFISIGAVLLAWYILKDEYQKFKSKKKE